MKENIFERLGKICADNTTLSLILLRIIGYRIKITNNTLTIKVAKRGTLFLKTIINALVNEFADLMKVDDDVKGR